MTTAALERFFRLYAAEVSYFSAKVRPAFRYTRVPYVELLPTREAFRKVIRPRTGLGMIPVVITPEDETWQDSSDSLDALEARFPTPPLYPTTPVQRLVAYLIELYADEFMMLPGLHYRWSFPESETKARGDFAAFNGSSEQMDRFADAVKMFTALIGVRPETIPAIEAHTEELLDLLETHLAAEPYLLGGRPSLADCGLIGPLYPHLYLDAVPGRLLRARAIRVCHWLERLNHPDPDAAGEWLPGDTLAPTLRPLLERIGRDAVPMILNTAHAFERWVDESAPAGELPRAVGQHPTALRGVEFERLTTPYTLWMVQRVLGEYQRLPAAGREAVDQALAGTGCEALLAYTPRHRVERRPFILHLAR